MAGRLYANEAQKGNGRTVPANGRPLIGPLPKADTIGCQNCARERHEFDHRGH